MLREVQRVPPVPPVHRPQLRIRQERRPVPLPQNLRQLRCHLRHHPRPLRRQGPRLHPDPDRVEPLRHRRPRDERGQQRGLRTPDPLPGGVGRGGGTGAGEAAGSRGRGDGSRPRPPLHRLPDRPQFPLQLRPRRKVLVPLQQHPRRPHPRREVGQDVEDPRGHRVRMAVVPDTVPLVAARHMHVRDRLDRQFVERPRRILAPVDVIGVQIGHVDQQPHPRAVDEVVQELALRHLLAGPGQQRGDVLHRERHRQRGLRDPYVRAQHVQRVPGARHRQQMARLQPRGTGAGAARADERDVLGDQRRAQRLGTLGEGGQPGLVGPVGAAETEGDAVRHDGHPALAQPQQRVGQMAGAEVLRDGLDPVDARHPLHGLRDLRPPADPRPQPLHPRPPPPVGDGVIAREGPAEPPTSTLQSNI